MLKVIATKFIQLCHGVDEHPGVSGTSSVGVGGLHPHEDFAIRRIVAGYDIWVSSLEVPDNSYDLLLGRCQALGYIHPSWLCLLCLVQNFILELPSAKSCYNAAIVAARGGFGA